MVNAIPTYPEIWGSASLFCTPPKVHQSLVSAGHPPTPPPAPLLSPLWPLRRLKAPCLHVLLFSFHSLSKSHICRFPAASPNVSFPKCHSPFQPTLQRPPAPRPHPYLGQGVVSWNGSLSWCGPCTSLPSQPHEGRPMMGSQYLKPSTPARHPPPP